MVVVQQRPYPLHNCFILNTQNSFFFKLKKINLNSVYIMYIHIPCVKKNDATFWGSGQKNCMFSCGILCHKMDYVFLGV
jgi:hypothetical protein